MITVNILSAVANLLPAVLILAFFGLCALGAIAAFVVSLMQQRRYETTALPDLGIEIPDVQEDSDNEDENITESRFAMDDDDDEGFGQWDDDENSQIMRELNELKNGSANKTERKSLFGRKK